MLQFLPARCSLRQPITLSSALSPIRGPGLVLSLLLAAATAGPPVSAESLPETATTTHGVADPSLAAGTADAAFTDGLLLADADAVPGTAMETIVVTGTRTSRLREEASVRTEVVDRQEVRRVAARTLADAIEFTPGIRVESNCQNCNETELLILGLAGRYNQVLFDGFPLLSALSSVYGLEQTPSVLIDQIEIVKGGASALYGPGAVGGVVNLIPRRPLRTGGDFDYRYDSVRGRPHHSVAGAFDWVPGDGAHGFTLYGQHDRHPGVDLTGDGFTEVPRKRLVVAGLRYEGDLTDRTRLKLSYEFNYENRRGGDRLDRPEFEADIAESIRSERHLATLSLEHEVTTDFIFGMRGAASLTERDSYYGGLGGDAPGDPVDDPDLLALGITTAGQLARSQFGRTRNPLLFGEVYGDYTLGDHRFLAGLQFTGESIDDRYPELDEVIDESYTNVGLFLQDEWTVTPDLDIVLGARVDKSSEVSGVTFSPRIATRYRPVESVTLRASLASGFLDPRVYDEDLHISFLEGERRRIVNSPDLGPERSLSTLAGIEWRPDALHGDLAFELNGFHTRIRDAFDLIETGREAGNVGVLERVNSDGARVYGVEANVSYAILPGLRAELGYIEQRSRFDSERSPFDDGGFESRNFFKTPDRSGVLKLVWDATDSTELFVGCRYTGRMDVPNFRTEQVVRSGSFFTIDVGLSHRIQLGDMSDMTVRVGVRNLTNSFQKDLERGPERDADFVYGPRQPRTFYTGVSFSF